jgi:acetylglutamate/LysW-gamma-L-alpha-aminoadipate kinase
VNDSLLRLLLEAGYAPVISPPAISYESEAINVDGDRAAAAIAAALGAETLVLLTGAPGLMRRFPDPDSLIQRLPRAEIPMAIEQFAEGRMRLKLLAAQEALAGGVRRGILAGSAGENPLQAALAGQGTIVE